MSPTPFLTQYLYFTGSIVKARASFRIMISAKYNALPLIVNLLILDRCVDKQRNTLRQ